MALQLKDRVSSGCTATGTNDIVFGDDTPSFHNWSVVDNGSTVYYCIVDKDEFEVGQGVKSTNGITRDTIFSSTNGGAKINLSGNADVFLTYPADKAVAKDENGDVTISGNLTVNGEVISDSVTLESLGIPHHNLIDVNYDGYVNLPTSPMGQSIQIMNNPESYSSRIDFLDDIGMHASIDVNKDEMRFVSKYNDVMQIQGADSKVNVNGSLIANSISTQSSFGYPNSWAVTAQPTEFLVTHSGATKSKVGTDGKMTATGFIGDGSQLTGVTVPDGSITTAKIANKNVTGGKIADNTVSALQLNVSGNGANNQMLCSSGNGAMKWVNQPSGGASTTYGGVATYTFIYQKGGSSANHPNPVNSTKTLSGLSGTWRSMGAGTITMSMTEHHYLTLFVRIS